MGRRASDAAKLDDVNFHTLRHTFEATWCSPYI
jgi:integrase